MPTIPLYQTSSPADAWHAVRSPGGYERWNFEAVRNDGQFELAITFNDGSPTNPTYYRNYKAFRAKPTRFRPPTPSEYPLATLTVRRRGEEPVSGSAVAPFVPALDSVGASIGSYRFQADHSGATHLTAGNESEIAVELTFKGKPIPPVWVNLHPYHNWIIAGSRSLVSGTIWIKDQPTPFQGIGFHDHYMGTQPVAADISDWLAGRIFLRDSVVAFHIVSTAAPNKLASLRAVRLTDDAIEELKVTEASIDLGRKFWSGTTYSSRVQLGEITLSRPVGLMRSAGIQELSYDATFRGEQGTAYCQVFHPPR